MRERAILQVGGPKGAGKTAFIEALLRETEGLVLAARCVLDEALDRPRASSPRSDPELRRYRKAGASGVARFAFPGAADSAEHFFTSPFMDEYSEAVVLEGDNPLGSADFSVFIAPAPRPLETLFVRRTRDRAREEGARADAMERMLRTPDGVARLLGQMVGEPIVALARRNPKLLEEARDNLLAGIAASRKAPPAELAEHWAVSDRYTGIERAQLVVVNLRDASEGARAEQLVADVARLRKDEALFRDILGAGGSRTAVTAVAANLIEPRDAGRTKATARVRRAMRARLR